VVSDKPFALDAAQARQAVEAAEAAGVVLSVYQNRRWDSDLLTVRRLLDEGTLGDVTLFESAFERFSPDEPVPAAGAGILRDFGAHLVDQALVLFGPVASVYAETDTRRAGVTADDDTFVALEHESGVRSHLWMSAVAPQLGPRFRVLGSAGGFVKYGLDVQEDALRAGTRPGDPDWGADLPVRYGIVGAGDDIETVATENGAYESYYAGIAAALLDGAPVPVDPREAVEALAVLEAARAYAESDPDRIDGEAL